MSLTPGSYTATVHKHPIPIGEGPFTVFSPNILDILSVGTDAQGRPAIWVLVLKDVTTTKDEQEKQYAFYHGFTGGIYPRDINVRKFIGTYSNPLTGSIGHVWYYEAKTVKE